MPNVVITALGPLYTLAEVKAALLVEHNDDDALIQAFMDAAELAVLQYCSVTLVPYGKEAVFKVAAIMVVSEFYEKRSGAAGIPEGARILLNPYRLYRL